MESDSGSKDLVARYSTAIFAGLVSEVSAVSLNHKLTQGELVEYFVRKVLKLFLTNQFDIGTGVIINHKQEESDQTDIIIYDNRMLPPFIKEGPIGIYPAESVVGIISVKTELAGTEIREMENSAKKLNEIVYSPSSRLYGNNKCMEPICAIIGFSWRGNPKQPFLATEKKRRLWLEKMSNIIMQSALLADFLG